MNPSTTTRLPQLYLGRRGRLRRMWGAEGAFSRSCEGARRKDAEQRDQRDMVAVFAEEHGMRHDGGGQAEERPTRYRTGGRAGQPAGDRDGNGDEIERRSVAAPCVNDRWARALVPKSGWRMLRDLPS